MARLSVLKGYKRGEKARRKHRLVALFLASGIFTSAPLALSQPFGGLGGRFQVIIHGHTIHVPTER